MTVAKDLLRFRLAGINASDTFWSSTPEERLPICNGCGAAEGIKIPSTLYGLDCRIAFDVHDWDYEFGKTAMEKTQADIRMLSNLVRIIADNTTTFPVIGYILRSLRRRRAGTLYTLVCEFGNSAFYND